MQILNKNRQKIVLRHRNGKLALTGEMQNGLKQGLWRWWDDSGTLFKEVHFIDGLPHGRVVDYDKLGRIQSETFYNRGTELSSGPVLRMAS